MAKGECGLDHYEVRHWQGWYRHITLSMLAPQRDYPLRAVFNGVRCVVRTGRQWRYLPYDLPPWNVIYQQAQR